MSTSITFDKERWAREMRMAGKTIYRQAEKVNISVAQELHRKIIDYTPVGNPSLWKWPASKGYKPGTLKESWTISFENEVVIQNTQPYAVRVEFGWSTQAPEGMMRRAIAEFPAITDKIAVRYKL